MSERALYGSPANIDDADGQDGRIAAETHAAEERERADALAQRAGRPVAQPFSWREATEITGRTFSFAYGKHLYHVWCGSTHYLVPANELGRSDEDSDRIMLEYLHSALAAGKVFNEGTPACCPFDASEDAGSSKKNKLASGGSMTIRSAATPRTSTSRTATTRPTRT